jgi:putative transposase
VVHIRPGKPTENAYAESFHGRLRDESLNVSWFWNLFDARRKISAWQQEYNYERPHSSLDYQTPEAFARQWLLASPSCSLDRSEEQANQGNPTGSLCSALTRLPL